MRRRELLRSGAGILWGSGVAGASDRRVDPYRPLGVVEFESARTVEASDDGRTAFVSTGDGFAVVDVSDPSSPTVVARKSGLLADLAGGPLQSVDVSVDGDRLVAAGPALAFEDTLLGYGVYDVSDPADPRRVAAVSTDYPSHNVYLDGGLAAFAALGRGEAPVVFADVTDDPPSELSRWSVVDADEAWSSVRWDPRTSHDVEIHEDVAYVTFWDAGTWLLDVSDPAEPEPIGRVGGRSPDAVADQNHEVATTELPGNSHTARVGDGGDLLTVGKEAWDVAGGTTGGGPGGIHLWDVSDPAEPSRLARVDPPPTPDPSPDGLWTTAHDIDLADGRLYTSWYRGGVKVYDVSDPSTPEVLAWWRRPDAANFFTARAAVPGEYYLATTVGTERAPGRLYVFPDEAGRQPDPPTLVSSPTPTERPTPTARPEPTRMSTVSTRTGRSTGTAPVATESDAPGFGIGTGVVAVAVVAFLRRRRRR